MWSVAIYYLVLLITVAVAIRRGGPFERWAAYTALIASVLTSALTPFPTWTDIELNIFVIDVLVLLSFWFIALKTQSFWPLLDHRLAINRYFWPYPEVHVCRDTGAALFAAFSLYILSDPAADHLCSRIVQSDA